MAHISKIEKAISSSMSCGKENNLLLREKSKRKMGSVQLEHENVTKLVLVTLRDRVEERRRFSSVEKDPMT